MSKAFVNYKLSTYEELDTLLAIEKKIIKMRLGIDEYDRKYTRKEIAAILKISASKVRNIEERALRKLSHPSRNTEVIRYEF